MRVLIIEDEGIVAMSMALILEDAGFEVSGIAGDTATAFALAARKRPEVATVDMNLKDGPVGGALALALRSDFGVRPVFITANPAMVPAEARAIALGVLEKPVSAPAILAAMRSARRLDGTGDAREPALANPAAEAFADRRTLDRCG